MRQSRIEIYPSRDGGWRWRARAANGKIIASGESYTRKSDAKRGARRARPGWPVVEVAR